ncbi:MAG TPA: methyltransferase domain-containing protein [bacterium]|nr:methyltransferase domain-containing protein [bacterium]
MQKIDKEKVKLKFEKALATYDKYASIQKYMACELVNELKKLDLTEFEKIYEIGTGTGILTAIISKELNYSNMICNDLSTKTYSFIAHLCNKSDFLECDGEDISKTPEKTDMIISNATFQWFTDLPGYLNKVASKMKERGIVAFSTFGTSQYLEIRALTGNCLKYFSKDELEDKIRENWETLHFSQWNETLKFKSLKDVLKHINSTGVSGAAADKIAFDFSEFQKRYKEKFFDGNYYTLTYNPQIWIIRRR